MNTKKNVIIILFIYALIWFIWIFERLISDVLEFFNVNNINTYLFCDQSKASIIISIIAFAAIVFFIIVYKNTRKFIDESSMEISKIIWPKFKIVINLTFSVLSFCLIIAFILGSLDIVFIKLTQIIYG